MLCHVSTGRGKMAQKNWRKACIAGDLSVFFISPILMSSSWRRLLIVHWWKSVVLVRITDANRRNVHYLSGTDKWPLITRMTGTRRLVDLIIQNDIVRSNRIYSLVFRPRSRESGALLEYTGWTHGLYLLCRSATKSTQWCLFSLSNGLHSFV